MATCSFPALCRGPRPTSTAGRPARTVAVRCSDKRVTLTRRETLAAGLALSTLHTPHEALAVQGLVAGRVPGTRPSDTEGFNSYTRPEGKSGGHGVGWSEIPRYSFEVPEDWEETPVSIADLGGAEVDLRFGFKPEGDLAVVVAPVLRFADVGYNASVTIEELGDPFKIINGFAPELIGRPIEEGDITEMRTMQDAATGLTYYLYDLKPHYLVAATAYKNRMFILTVRATALQWRKAADKLYTVRDTFRVSTA